MLKRIVIGVALLLVSGVAISVAPVVQAQIKSNPRLLEPPAASVAPQAAAAGYEIVKSAPVTIAPKTSGDGTTTRLFCPAGKKPVGGGLSQVSNSLHIISSFPLDGGVGYGSWAFLVYNDGATATSVIFYAVCIVTT